MFDIIQKFCMSFESGKFVPQNFGSTTSAGAILCDFVEVIFGFCFQCDLNIKIIMPSVPQGAFAACKVRERSLKIAKLQSGDQESEKMEYFGKYLELSPVKYNSKLMMSIWGLYNRYSVHNFKQNTDASNGVLVAGSQQLNGYPANADRPGSANPKTTKSSTVLVTEWINIWGSHKH